MLAINCFFSLLNYSVVKVATVEHGLHIDLLQVLHQMPFLTKPFPEQNAGSSPVEDVEQQVARLEKEAEVQLEPSS